MKKNALTIDGSFDLGKINEAYFHGPGFDEVYEDKFNHKRKIPKVHQIPSVSENEDTGEFTINYIVKHIALCPPNAEQFQELKKIIYEDDIHDKGVICNANTQFLNILHHMNTEAYAGYTMGEYESGIAHNFTLTQNLVIKQMDFSFEQVMLTGIVTPKQANQLLKHDPYDQKLFVWRDAMALHAGKKKIGVEEATTITTNIIQKQRLKEALNQNISGIAVYKPMDNYTRRNHKDHNTAYVSVADFGADVPIFGKAFESAVYMSTKCDSIIGGINLAAMGNFALNIPGIFKPTPYQNLSDPDEARRMQELSEDFLRTTAYFMTNVFDPVIAKRDKMRRSR